MDSFGLIIGAMKSGTSSLFRHLGRHPEVCKSTEKEPNFFADDAHFGEGLGWYLRRWPTFDPGRHKIAIEASTHYTKLPAFPNAAERMAALRGTPAGHGIRLRFIYIMREPIARIESHLAHARDESWEVARPLADGGIHPQILAVGRYAMQLDEYRKRFPPEDLLLLDFEDLVDRPAELMPRVCRFLGVDADFRFEGLGRAYNTAGDRARRRTLPERARRLVHGEPPASVRLDDRQRALVYAAIGDDLRRLPRDYAFDISRWRVPPP